MDIMIRKITNKELEKLYEKSGNNAARASRMLMRAEVEYGSEAILKRWKALGYRTQPVGHSNFSTVSHPTADQTRAIMDVYKAAEGNPEKAREILFRSKGYEIHQKVIRICWIIIRTPPERYGGIASQAARNLGVSETSVRDYWKLGVEAGILKPYKNLRDNLEARIA